MSYKCKWYMQSDLNRHLQVYQTRALTIELYMSGESGSRTPLSQFAKLACHLNIPQVGRPAGLEPDSALCRRALLTLEQDDEWIL